MRGQILTCPNQDEKLHPSLSLGGVTCSRAPQGVRRATANHHTTDDDRRSRPLYTESLLLPFAAGHLVYGLSSD